MADTTDPLEQARALLPDLSDEVRGELLELLACGGSDTEARGTPTAWPALLRRAGLAHVKCNDMHRTVWLGDFGHAVAEMVAEEVLHG